MIIEIKGLPTGQKIKHINVDITFDDDGTATVRTDPVFKPPVSIEQGNTQDLPAIPVPPTNNIDDRPKKDIPSEMTDMEF